MRSEARPHPRFMKKSIGDNMFLKEWGFDKGLALVKKAGYDGIELWLGATPWFRLDTTDAQVRELRRKVDDAGLVVSNVSNSLDWDRPLSSRDPRVREQAVRHIPRQIESAQIPGPRITRVHVKDVMRHRGRCGNESVYTNLFLGDNNWKAIREAFQKVGYDGWLIAEMEARYRYARDQQFYDTAAAMDRFISGQL